MASNGVANDVNRAHLNDTLGYQVAPYNEMFQKSIGSPEEFWAEQAKKITWFKKWDKVLDNSNPPFTKWLFVLLYIH